MAVINLDNPLGANLGDQSKARHESFKGGSVVQHVMEVVRSNREIRDKQYSLVLFRPSGVSIPAGLAVVVEVLPIRLTFLYVPSLIRFHIRFLGTWVSCAQKYAESMSLA